MIIKIRTQPLFKSIGMKAVFKNYYLSEHHGARIYKKSVSSLYIEIWKDHYRSGDDNIHYKTLITKQFPLIEPYSDLNYILFLGAIVELGCEFMAIKLIEEPDFFITILPKGDQYESNRCESRLYERSVL